MLDFEGSLKTKKIGRELGKFCGILVFLSVMHLILTLLDKIPKISYLWLLFSAVLIYAIMSKYGKN